jgi:glc operon protein GlcG
MNLIYESLPAVPGPPAQKTKILKVTTDTIVQLFKAHPSALITPCRRSDKNPPPVYVLGQNCENSFLVFRRKIMSSNEAEIATEAPPTSNPLDAIPAEIPFDVPYGRPISIYQAEAVIHAAMAEAKQRNWKMNIAVADSGGNLVAFQRMDGAMLASIQIAQHKAKAAVTFRRPTKVFEDGVNLMHLNYLLAFDGVICSRGGIPLIDQGDIIGAIGVSGGTDSQDEVVSKAGAAVINKLPERIK